MKNAAYLSMVLALILITSGCVGGGGGSSSGGGGSTASAPAPTSASGCALNDQQCWYNYCNGDMTKPGCAAAATRFGNTNSVQQSLPSCQTTTSGLFTALPFKSINNIDYIVPLGATNPKSGHVFPTDHMYWYLPTYLDSQNNVTTDQTSVYAPGSVTITDIQVHYFDDGAILYKVMFSPCREVAAYFDHVTSLFAGDPNNPNLPNIAAAFGNGSEVCQSYTAGNNTVKACDVSVDISLKAGDPIGTAGGFDGMMQRALDFGIIDTRISLNFLDPSKYPSDHLETGCSINYYPQDAASNPNDSSGTANQYVLDQLLGDYTGAAASHGCGEVNQDIAGTAKGNWFNPASDSGSTNRAENTGLSLGDGNTYEPDTTTATQLFSVGSSISSLPVDQYYFVPKQTGTVNVDFAEVKPGQLYCYESNTQMQWDGIILIELSSDAQHLSIEWQNGGSTGDCNNGDQPLSLTANATVFER